MVIDLKKIRTKNPDVNLMVDNMAYYNLITFYEKNPPKLYDYNLGSSKDKLLLNWKLKYDPDINYKKYYNIGIKALQGYKLPMKYSEFAEYGVEINSEMIKLPISDAAKDRIIAYHAYLALKNIPNFKVCLKIPNKWATFDFIDWVENKCHFRQTKPVTLYLVLDKYRIYLSCMKTTLPFLYSAFKIYPISENADYVGYNSYYTGDATQNRECIKFFKTYLMKYVDVNKQIEAYVGDVQQAIEDGEQDDWIGPYLANGNYYFIVNEKINPNSVIPKLIYEFENTGIGYNGPSHNRVWELFNENRKVGLLFHIPNGGNIGAGRDGVKIYKCNNNFIGLMWQEFLPRNFQREFGEYFYPHGFQMSVKDLGDNKDSPDDFAEEIIKMICPKLKKYEQYQHNRFFKALDQFDARLEYPEQF
jgi:hypothetical protein